MKKILIAAVFLAMLFLTSSAQGVCIIQPLESAAYCESDPDGTCCVVEYEEDGMTCYEIWCSWYNQCAWALEVDATCN